MIPDIGRVSHRTKNKSCGQNSLSVILFKKLNEKVEIAANKN